MKLNGKEVTLTQPASLKEFLEKEKYDPVRIAVELNGAIIPKGKYAEVFLKQEDTLEVVSFVGGG